MMMMMVIVVHVVIKCCPDHNDINAIYCVSDKYLNLLYKYSSICLNNLVCVNFCGHESWCLFVDLNLLPIYNYNIQKWTAPDYHYNNSSACELTFISHSVMLYTFTKYKTECMFLISDRYRQSLQPMCSQNWVREFQDKVPQLSLSVQLLLWKLKVNRFLIRS